MAVSARDIAKALVAANPTPSNAPMGGFGGAPSTLPAGQLSPLVASYEAWSNGRANGPGLPRDFSTFLAGSFGPLAPVQPISIDNPEPGQDRPDPRRYQYQVGWNMPIGPPGSEGLKLATFPQLRTIADTYSVARACINLRKQELVGLEWDIVPTKAAEKKMRGHTSDRQEWDTRRARIMRFFKKPDPNYFSFASWFSAQLEDVFAVDALSLYLHPSRMRGKGVMGSDLAAFELIDGTTIRPMIDVHGAKPTPPNPAYQQFIYGVPRVDLMTVMSGDDIKDMGEAKYRQYTGDQLMYLPYDARDWTPYGFAPVEKALVPILSGLNRQNWQLEYFSEGSIPGLFITAGDPNSTPQQIRELQDALNAMAGDPAWKHKIIVLPNGATTMPQTPAELAGQFDETIMTQVCMAFDVMPMELGITPRSSSSGHSGGAVNQMGKLSSVAQNRKANTPLLHRFMEIFDYVIQVVCHQDDMRFMYEGLGEVEDEATQINNLVNEISHGMKSIDEARIIRGEQPWGLPITSDPVMLIATGLIPLKGLDPVTGQPPQPILPAGTPIGPDGQPMIGPGGPGGPPPATPGGGAPAKPAPKPKPAAPAGGATPAHAGAAAAGATTSTKAVTVDPPVNVFAALRELDLVGRRLTKGVSIDGWRREHIPADMWAGIVDGGTVHYARQALKTLAAGQRHTEPVFVAERIVSDDLRLLAGGLSSGAVAPASFVDRAVAVMRTGIRTALGHGAAHARSTVKSAIPAGFEGRFQLYGGSIPKAYEQGYGLATFGDADNSDDIVVRWHAKDSGACDLCEERDGQAYTIDGLPGFPGDGGFGTTADICRGGPNCRCRLAYERLAPGESHADGTTTTPPPVLTPAQQHLATTVTAARNALQGPAPETAFAAVLDQVADQLAELQRPYLTGLLQDVLAARNNQAAQHAVEVAYTRSPDGGHGWFVPAAIITALVAAAIAEQVHSQQQAAPVTATGTAPAATKSAGPAVPAATIVGQLSRNYPMDSLGWVSDAQWIGPVHLPTDAVDVDDVKSWAASHQASRVNHFESQLRTHPEVVRPVVAVHEPGETNVKIIDGHHRFLAARNDGQPVTAYIGQVDHADGPWSELHTHQQHQGSDGANKTAVADLVKAGPKGYIHGWIFVGARPRVGKAVRQMKRDRKGNVVTDRTGRISAVKDGHVHITWDDGKKNRVEHIHEPGVKGGLSKRSEHPGASGRSSEPVKREPKAAPVKAEPKAAPETHGHSDFAAHIASGVKTRQRLSGGKQGETHRVEFNNGHQAVHKIIRTDDYQNGKDQVDAEELSALVAHKLGVRAARVHRVGDEEAYQDLMPGKTAAEHFPDDKTALSVGGNTKDKHLADIVKSDEGLRIGLLDMLVGNPDRHGMNWLVGPDGKPTVIDNSLAFHHAKAAGIAAGSRGPFRGRFMDKDGFSLGKNDLSTEDISAIRTHLDSLRPEFERLGRTKWFDQMTGRLDEISAHATGNRKVVA